MPTNEVARNYQQPEMPRNAGAVHQPVVICIDTSGSMRDLAEDGRKKYEIVEEMINGLANMDLNDYDKENTEICILVFDDDVRTLVDWRSLASFEGGIKLDVAGCTSLGTAVITAIDKTRERRKVYYTQGIDSKRAQIFVYTDGVSTESLEAAYARAQEYLNRSKPSAKMYVTLIPPAADPAELLGFGEAVTILKADDCVNGLPAAFKFMQASVVAASQSVVGSKTETVVPDGVKPLYRDGLDGTTKNESGQKVVIDKVNSVDWDW